MLLEDRFCVLELQKIFQLLQPRAKFVQGLHARPQAMLKGTPASAKRALKSKGAPASTRHTHKCCACAKIEL